MKAKYVSAGHQGLRIIERSKASGKVDSTRVRRLTVQQMRTQNVQYFKGKKLNNPDFHSLQSFDLGLLAK